MHILMYVYVFMYTCTHTHTQKLESSIKWYTSYSLSKQLQFCSTASKQRTAHTFSPLFKIYSLTSYYRAARNEKAK